MGSNSGVGLPSGFVLDDELPEPTKSKQAPSGSVTENTPTGKITRFFYKDAKTPAVPINNGLPKGFQLDEPTDNLPAGFVQDELTHAKVVEKPQQPIKLSPILPDEIKDTLLDFLKPDFNLGDRRPIFEQPKQPEYTKDPSGKIIPRISERKPTLGGEIKNLIIKPFVKSPGDAMVKAVNIGLIHKKLNPEMQSPYPGVRPIQNPYIEGRKERVTKEEISRNYDDLAYSMDLKGPTPSKVMGDVMTGAAAVGLVSNTVPTALALAGFGAISELDRFLTSKITKGEYKAFQSKEFHEVITPESASEFSKFAIELADFTAKGGALHSLYKKAPGVAERLTKRKLERYNLPREVFIPAEAVKSALGGELGKATTEQADMIKDLNLNRGEVMDAVKNGLNVRVPVEKIITMGNRPWFKELKKFFNVKESPEKPIFARPEKPGVVRKGLPAPSEKLPEGFVVDEIPVKPKVSTKIETPIKKNTSDIAGSVKAVMLKDGSVLYLAVDPEGFNIGQSADETKANKILDEARKDAVPTLQDKINDQTKIMERIGKKFEDYGEGSGETAIELTTEAWKNKIKSSVKTGWITKEYSDQLLSEQEKPIKTQAVQDAEKAGKVIGIDSETKLPIIDTKQPTATSLKTVSDVESFIAEGAKRLGGRNKFLASDEYKAVFPQVEKIYQAAKTEHAAAGQKAMTEAGIAEGDRVSTPMQGLTGGELAKGTIFMKAGVPWVKLDSPQMTSKGYKKQVQWHKGWGKESTVTKLFLQYAGKSYPVSSTKDAADKWEAIRNEGMKQGLGPDDVNAPGTGPEVVDAQGNVVGSLTWNATFKPSPSTQKAISEIKQGIVEAKAKPSEVKANIITKLEEALKTAKTDKETLGMAIPRGETVGRGIRKESALDDAHLKALKKAPRLTFHIPGDGDFSVINTKEAITELLARVKKLQTTGLEKSEGPPTRKSTATAKFKLEKFDKEVGNLLKTPKGYVTDGKFLALGETPKGGEFSARPEIKKEALDKLLNQKSEGKAELVQFESGTQKSGEYATSPDPIRTNLSDNKEVIRAVFDIGKSKDVFVNQNYVLYFQENFKNPTYSYGDGKILVNAGGKRVGIIMPVIGETETRISRGDIALKEEAATEPPKAEEKDTKIDWMDNYTEALANIKMKEGLVHPSEVTHATFNGKAAGVKASEIVADLVRAGVEENLATRLTAQEFKGARAPAGASASTGSEKLGKFEQTPSPDKTPLKLGEETVKIYKAVNASLNIKSTLRQGNVSPYLGLTYHPTENISTVGLNAVSVNAHELAHRVDGAQKIVEKVRATTGRGDVTRKAITDVYVKFYPGGKKNHPLRKRLTEGYATLVQKYLEQPTFMETEYPALVQEFLKPGGKYYTDAIGVLLKGFRSLIDRYQALDPLEKIGARVTEGQSGDLQKTYFSLKDKADALITNAFFPLEKVGSEAGLSGSINDPSLWAKMSRESKAIILTNINSDKGLWMLGPDGNFQKVFPENFKTMVDGLEKDGLTAKLGWYLVARREVALLDEGKNIEDKIKQSQEQLASMTKEPTDDPDELNDIKLLRIVINDMKKALTTSRAVFHKDGFTEKEVREAVDLYKKDFENHPLTLMHDKFNDEGIKLLSHPLVQLLKPDAAEKMLAKKGYASFKRELYDELEGEQIIPATLQVGKTKVSSMLGRTGSEKPILNPFYSAIINHAEIVKKALKQIVYNKLVKIAKSGQFAELFQVEPIKAIPDARTGVILYPQEKDTAIIMARENYKRIAIRVDNYLKTAIDDMLTHQNFGLFEQIFTLPSKMFTISTTGMFIPFTLVNYIRDQITAVAQTKTNYIPLVHSFKMLLEKIKNVGGPEATFMAEYFALGGEKNTLINIFDLSPEDALKVIAGEKTGLDKLGSFFEKIGSILSAPANYSETATRLTEYVRLRLVGKSQVAALDGAARVTVPFKYKGSSKGFGLLMRSIPYFSSSIQALRQAGRSGFGSKKEAARWWAVYSAVTAAIVATAYYTIHNASDEQKNQYKDLSPEELAMNIYWPARGGKGLHKIPINQEMGGIGAMISMAIAQMAGTNYKAGDYVSAGVSFLPRQIQPAEWQQIVFAWIPQIMKPAVSIATNTRDFPNIRPIEGMSQQWKEPKMRFTEATSGVARWVGDKTGWSPIMVDFFMQGYAGRGATGWLNPMERMNLRPIQADKYYFEGGRRIQNYYNLKKQNDQQYTSLKESPDSYTAEQEDAILDKRDEYKDISDLLKDYRLEKKEGGKTEDLRDEIIALVDKL